MILKGRDAFSGILLSLAIVAALALLFGWVADAHYDGPFAATLPAGAPRNFLTFRSARVYPDAAFFSFLVVTHWLLLARRQNAIKDYAFANVAYALAMLLLPLLWTDSILDDYYHTSIFCLSRGEAINAFDAGWRCVAAYYAREVIIPIAIPALIVISVILRLWPRPTSSKSDHA